MFKVKFNNGKLRTSRKLFAFRLDAKFRAVTDPLNSDTITEHEHGCQTLNDWNEAKRWNLWNDWNV